MVQKRVYLYLKPSYPIWFVISVQSCLNPFLFLVFQPICWLEYPVISCVITPGTSQRILRSRFPRFKHLIAYTIDVQGK